MNKAIILCSGGIDSVVTAYYVKHILRYNKMKFLFFNYGQRNLTQERKASKYFAQILSAEFNEINLKELKNISNSLLNKKGNYAHISVADLKDSSKESQKWYVPLRNLFFINYASAIAEADYLKSKIRTDIFTGFKNEGKEAYPDTTSDFVNKINELNQIVSISKCKLIAPLIKKDKEDIILLGKKLNVDLSKTYSCYSGKYKEHCGTCLSCKLRQQGFYWANLKDSTKYKLKT